MSTIKSPFNFVPVSSDVYFPDWARQVSHDIPFSDGDSGYLDVELTAETPIFIRNWSTSDDEKNYKSFSKDPQGRYFIPGTSLKGEVRSVLEILSFAKMHIDESMAFAQRDWYNSKLYPLKTQKGIRCGYLRYDDDKYHIVDCGEPFRIGHKEIDAYAESVCQNRKDILSSKFSKGCYFDLNKPVIIDNITYDPKTSEFKGKLFEGINLKGLPFRQTGEDNGKKIVEYNPDGEIIGDIVMTGSPNQWNPDGKKVGKYYEFVFPCEINHIYQLSEEKFNEYRFIYSDSKVFQDLCRHKKEIPVFFRIKNNEITDLGLTLLYKLPYTYTPKDLLSNKHKSPDLDLAETIFGMIKKDKNESLKGRVQFSHLYATEAKECDKDVTLTLASPKASYYPMYLRQDGGDYYTYNDMTNLAGRKRFVVRNRVWAKTSTETVDTVFRPLDKGSVFKGRIYFHNLRPAEIGAMLSALTFHGTEQCRHQIGLAKPYGYGRIKVIVTKGTLQHECEWYMSEFERVMRDFKSDWCECTQIRELLSLATPLAVDDDRFSYMNLAMKGTNEFTEAKKNKEYLKVHSAIVGRATTLVSIYDKYKEDILRQQEEEKRNQYDSLKAQISDKLNYGLLQDAYCLYGELQKLGLDDFSTEIAVLKQRIVDNMLTEAEDKEKSCRYQDAIDVYKVLQDIWGRPSLPDIERLNSLLSAASKESIADGFCLNSIAACSNVLRKWKATHGGKLSMHDLEDMASSIKKQLPGAKKDLQKKWTNEKGWEPIRKELGEELSRILFEMINN